MKGAHFNHEMFRIVMKKTLALILLASLILSAVSCGSGETPSGDTETSAPSSGDTSGEETVDENSRDAVKFLDSRRPEIHRRDSDRPHPRQRGIHKRIPGG